MFLRQKSKGVTRMLYACSKPHTRNSFGLLPQGYCVTKNLNLEKATSSVLSVIIFQSMNESFKSTNQMRSCVKHIIYLRSYLKGTESVIWIDPTYQPKGGDPRYRTLPLKALSDLVCISYQCYFEWWFLY